MVYNVLPAACEWRRSSWKKYARRHRSEASFSSRFSGVSLMETEVSSTESWCDRLSQGVYWVCFSTIVLRKLQFTNSWHIRHNLQVIAIQTRNNRGGYLHSSATYRMEMSVHTTVLTKTHSLWHTHTNGLWCALIGWKAGKVPSPCLPSRQCVRPYWEPRER